MIYTNFTFSVETNKLLIESSQLKKLISTGCNKGINKNLHFFLNYIFESYQRFVFW